jgi:hypothetical protein
MGLAGYVYSNEPDHAVAVADRAWTPESSG